MLVFAQRVEHAFDMSVQCPHDTDARKQLALRGARRNSVQRSTNGHARPKSARVSSRVGAVPLSMIRLALFLKKLSILFSPHEKALDHVCDRGDRL